MFIVLVLLSGSFSLKEFPFMNSHLDRWQDQGSKISFSNLKRLIAILFLRNLCGHACIESLLKDHHLWNFKRFLRIRFYLLKKNYDLSTFYILNNLCYCENMRISPTSSPNLDLRIAQQSQVQRDLSKLKFHLRMKRKLFNPAELTHISQRIKQCQQESNRLKQKSIHLKAFQLVNKSPHINESNHGFTANNSVLAHSSKPSRQKT